MDERNATDGTPEQPDDGKRFDPRSAGPDSDPDGEDDRKARRENLRRLFETSAGEEELFELLRTGNAPDELLDLTDAERRSFASRWKDGFLMQVMRGEFDLMQPLTEAEEAEYWTTADWRRRWLLETRRRLSQDEI